jgi:hypothetical protein
MDENGLLIERPSAYQKLQKHSADGHLNFQLVILRQSSGLKVKPTLLLEFQHHFSILHSTKQMQ